MAELEEKLLFGALAPPSADTTGQALWENGEFGQFHQLPTGFCFAVA